MLAEWEQQAKRGGDARYGVFTGDRVAGSCGYHRRLGPDVLELGYWTHVAFLRRGLATRVAAILTDAAFALPGIARVEIHHDKDNLASAGVPRRLGYRLVGERRLVPAAPAETGTDCVWRVERWEWLCARADRSALVKPPGGGRL